MCSANPLGKPKLTHGPIAYDKHRLGFALCATTIMIWGGLRSGISLVLALSLPTTVHRVTKCGTLLLTIEGKAI